MLPFITDTCPYLSLKTIVSPLSPAIASMLSMGSHLLGAAGLGLTFLGFGFGPANQPNVNALAMESLFKVIAVTLQCPTIELLNAFDVIFREQEACCV